MEYHCHYCSEEFVLKSRDELKCPYCGSTSIEQIDNGLKEEEIPW